MSHSNTPVYTLGTPVAGFGWTVPSKVACAPEGWRGVQQTLAGALRLVEGARGGDAVAWCGLLEGSEGAERRLGLVLTWSTDAVGPETIRSISKALAVGLGADVRMEGPQAPEDGYFPTVAILRGALRRVWLPDDPAPVIVWAGPGPQGEVALMGGPELSDAVTVLDAPDVVLARARDDGPEPVDKDEALFLVHAAGRLTRVVDAGLVLRWMQRRLGPVLAEEGLITDDGRIDGQAVREAVTDALEELRRRPEPQRRRVVQVLGEPLAAHGAVDSDVARELALALGALGLLPEQADAS